jgi:hypothetical protein
MNAATRQYLRELESLNLDKNSEEYQYLRKMSYLNTLAEFQAVFNRDLHQMIMNLFSPATSELWNKIAGLRLTITWLESRGAKWFLEQSLSKV